MARLERRHNDTRKRPAWHEALTYFLIVGAMMLRNIVRVDWNDYSESIPAFLIFIGIPLSYSIADGLALGFISHPVVKLLSGRRREVSSLTYLLTALLVAYFLFVRSRMN